MQRNNQVVLMLSASVMLSGVVGGALSLGWDALKTLQKQPVSTQVVGLPDLVPAFGSSVSETEDAIANNVPARPPVNFTQPRKPDANAPRFSIVPLDTQVGERTFYPVALNNRGEVLGGVMINEADNPQRFRLDAYLYRQNTLTHLAPLPGFRYSWPMAINNRGQVVCVAYEPVSPARNDVQQTTPGPLLPGRTDAPKDDSPVLSGQHPASAQPNRRIVLWDQGVTRDLQMAELFAARGMSQDVLEMLSRVRIGLNDRGQITLALGSLYWWAQGKLHLAGGRVSMVAPLLPLNNQGVLVRPAVRALASGYDRWDHSALPTSNISAEWYDVSHQRETPLPASEVWDMNDKSEVLCSSLVTRLQSARQFFVADRHGMRRRVAVMPSYAASFINNKGQIVGLSSRSLTTRPAHAMPAPRSLPQQGPFWFEKERLYDLNDLLPASSGWTILQVRDLNDRGEMLAYAIDAEQKTHPVLLRPDSTVSK